MGKMEEMQLVVLALLLGVVLALLSTALQRQLRRARRAMWALPLILAAIFAGASVLVDAFSWSLTACVALYAAAPLLCAALVPPGAGSKPHRLDFAAVVLLWLPLEFNAAKDLVPRPAQGFLHSVAYGIAILLGLTIFLIVRELPGMKYNLPRTGRDFWLPLAGFVLCAPVLIAIGIPIGFIPPPHLPTQPGGRMAAAIGIIFAGTALPEEILFRALIQNLLTLRFGRTWRVLFLASVIFGSAHLDNGPQAAPNWRYMILATVAGVAYGKVFDKASTVLSSATLHCMVDWTKHFFF